MTFVCLYSEIVCFRAQASLAQLKELSGAVDAGKEAALNLQLAQEIIRGVEITPAIVPITVDLLLKAKKLGVYSYSAMFSCWSFYCA